MLKKIASVVLMAGLTGALLFCSAQSGKDKFIKIYLPGGPSIAAELAATDEERQKGLMFREKLLPDQGMLFVFDVEDYYSFWMKNTLIALDLIWLDKERRIVHIERDVPPCKADPCPSYTPKRPGSYVLELKAGSADRLKLKLFDKLEFTLPGSKIR
jgi:uncharacterized membrane protein (UPF0127 family)